MYPVRQSYPTFFDAGRCHAGQYFPRSGGERAVGIGVDVGYALNKTINKTAIFNKRKTQKKRFYSFLAGPYLIVYRPGTK